MEKTEIPAFFGDWLKQRRKTLDLTQKELSERAGCSVFAVRKIEAGERRPSKQLAEWLAKALEIPPEIQQIFIRTARGELNLDRLPLPSLISEPVSGESSSHFSSQFPAYFTPLVGREAELSALARIFNDPQCRLLTLTGLGGIGKTRLAVEFASTQLPKFPGGVFYVPLASLNLPELIAPAIADVLQLSFSGPTDPKEQLINHMANHFKRPTLFVLDNMEHLLPAATTENIKIRPTDLLAEMLQRLPVVNFLVTSRERLNLQGEWTYELHGLPAPPPVFLERLQEYSAPVLFLQNARRAKADFTITREEQSALVRICHLLEGIPLALELAATWVGMLSCEEIAAEIESNIDFLSTSMRDIPERHRSLRAIFDHSWKLLAPEEKGALCQLSVFRGGFSREAAVQIAGASLSLLASLVSKSLVHRVERGRYDLHEVIRQYASSYLGEDPHHLATSDRHSEYYLTLISSKESTLKSAAQQNALRELTLEIDNVRVAWTWAIAREKFSLIGRAGRGFSWFFETSGLLTEGVEQFELLVTALKTRTRNSAQEKVLGQTLAQQSLLLFRKGQFDQAQMLLEESLALLQPFGEPALLTDPLIFLGIISHLNGKLERSQALFNEGLACAQASGDEWFSAYAIYNLGYVDSLAGRYTEGYERMMAGLTIWRHIGDPHSIAMGLNFLTPTLVKLGRYKEAETYLQESLALCSRSGNRWGSGTAYRYLGLTKIAQGNHVEAQALLRQSLEIFSGYIVGWDIAISLIYLGEATLAAGNLQEAKPIYLDALQVATTAKAIPLALDALIGLADLNARVGEYQLAIQLAFFVQNHAISTQENKDAAGRFLTEIEKRLPASQMQTARTKASDHSLKTIVQELVC
jgi:predicted ATPase/transcriptional regulator with XRE-family HTH domain